MNFQVVYSEKQVADPGHDPVEGVLSPSASKPKVVAEALAKRYPDLTFVEPEPLSVEDFYRCHSREYVDGVFSKQRKNGFGTYSDSVNESLPYTSGAMYTAARIATVNKPAAALVSGFHHAGYDGFEHLGYFCTFNGLVASARKLIDEDGLSKVAIIDCDMHEGNGTDDILYHNSFKHEDILHNTFGERYFSQDDASSYLKDLETGGLIENHIMRFQPDVILYQSGADVHVNDPFGGVLTEAEMITRDLSMFHIGKKLGIPIAWCLAGGYQVDPDGSIDTVIRLHLNTFEAVDRAYGD